LGSDTPTLKKWIKSDEHAIRQLEAEIIENIDQLRKHGLFFSFTTDPMLPETRTLTLNAIRVCANNGIPVIILTKCAAWAHNHCFDLLFPNRDKIAVGFTLTGHDEMECGASTNAERITAMKALHTAGFRMWASIEPVVDFRSSLQMIMRAANWCDHFKIGLMSGKKYPMNVLHHFILDVGGALDGHSSTVYFKDSITSQAVVRDSDWPTNRVGRDFNIFKV
jgi:DNA repair photolyase